ncbi:putative Tic20 family protein [Chitinophagaceae bacterium OAS944]
MTPRDQNVRTWSMLCHLSALLGLLWWPGIVIGPLIVWQIKKNELPEIDPHGKEALNFQLTFVVLYFIAQIVLGIIAGITFGIGLLWGSPFTFLGSGLGLLSLLGIITLVALVLAVVAGIKANNGEPYKYPFSIKFVK